MNRREFLHGLCCLVLMARRAHRTCVDAYYVTPNGQRYGVQYYVDLDAEGVAAEVWEGVSVGTFPETEGSGRDHSEFAKEQPVDSERVTR